MLAMAGRYFWGGLAVFFATGVAFLWVRDDPDATSSLTSAIQTLCLLSTAIAGIVTLLGLSDKIINGSSRLHDRRIDDFKDHSSDGQGPPSRRYRRGDRVEFVREDSSDDRSNLVEVRRFIEYNERGSEVWEVLSKYKESC